MAAPSLNESELRFLRALLRHRVRFMVVGLSAAALQGAPVVTQDVDLWFEDLNDPRLREALREVGAASVAPSILNPPMFAGGGVELFDIVLTLHGLGSFRQEWDNCVDVSLGRCSAKARKRARKTRSPAGRGLRAAFTVPDAVAGGGFGQSTAPGRHSLQDRTAPAGDLIPKAFLPERGYKPGERRKFSCLCHRSSGVEARLRANSHCSSTLRPPTERMRSNTRSMRSFSAPAKLTPRGRAGEEFLPSGAVLKPTPFHIRAHATAGVKECWLVLGPEKQIAVHHQPPDGRYTASTLHGPDGTVKSEGLPQCAVDLAGLFATGGECRW